MPSAAGIFDDQLHQQPAKSLSLQIGPNQDRVFAAGVVRVGMQAHDAQHRAGRLFDGDKRHGARVIDLGEAGDEGVAELLHRREETQPQVVRGHGGKERHI